MQVCSSMACSDKDDTLGVTGPTLSGCPVFPHDNSWNQDVSELRVHANSDRYIDTIGRDATLHPDFGAAHQDGAPVGIPYLIVDGSQPDVPIEFVRSERQSNPGPYPIPTNAPIEGGPNSDGDRHVIVVDSGECRLYELYAARPTSEGWEANSGAAWDLRRITRDRSASPPRMQPVCPYFPGLSGMTKSSSDSTSHTLCASRLRTPKRDTCFRQRTTRQPARTRVTLRWGYVFV